MKTLSHWILFLLSLSFTGCKPSAPSVTPPAEVIASFTSNFPDTRKVHWAIEDSGRYKADFNKKGSDCSALFMASGEWILTETKINRSELPATVNRTLDDGFGEFTVGVIRQVVSAKEGNYFKIKLSERKTLKNLYLNYSGVILKNEDAGKDED